MCLASTDRDSRSPIVERIHFVIALTEVSALMEQNLSPNFKLGVICAYF